MIQAYEMYGITTIGYNGAFTIERVTGYCVLFTVESSQLTNKTEMARALASIHRPRTVAPVTLHTQYRWLLTYL